MKASPSPKAVFDRLVSSFRDALCSEQWRLRSFAQCDVFFQHLRPKAKAKAKE